MSLDYALTALVVILLPGTGVLYTLALGLSQGWRATVLAACGCTLGILPHLAAAIGGLAAVLHASAIAFQALTYLGAAYLFYMAWSVWRDGGTLQLSPEQRHLRPARIILNGVLMNILNPKLSLFFLAFLPQFVDGAAAFPLWLQFAVLGTVANILFGLVDVVIVMLAASILGRLKRSSGIQVLVRRAGGAILVGMGVHLALQRS